MALSVALFNSIFAVMGTLLFCTGLVLFIEPECITDESSYFWKRLSDSIPQHERGDRR